MCVIFSNYFESHRISSYCTFLPYNTERERTHHTPHKKCSEPKCNLFWRNDSEDEFHCNFLSLVFNFISCNLCTTIFIFTLSPCSWAMNSLLSFSYDNCRHTRAAQRNVKTDCGDAQRRFFGVLKFFSSLLQHLRDANFILKSWLPRSFIFEQSEQWVCMNSTSRQSARLESWNFVISSFFSSPFKPV